MVEVLIAVTGGIAVGLALGLTGGGGAILAVPILVYGLGFEPFAATTASLLVVGLSAASGVVAQHRAGRVRWKAGAGFGALAVGGAVTGSLASAAINPNVLLVAFSGLVLVSAWLLWRKGNDVAALKGSGVRGHSPVSPVRLVLAATGVGLLTGFFGVGGGFAVVPALVLVLGFSTPLAMGTSLVVIVLMSVQAFAVRFAHGADLDWGVIAIVAFAGMVAAVMGASLGQHLSERALTRGFAVLLVGVAVFTGVRSVLALV